MTGIGDIWILAKYENLYTPALIKIDLKVIFNISKKNLDSIKQIWILDTAYQSTKLW